MSTSQIEDWYIIAMPTSSVAIISFNNIKRLVLYLVLERNVFCEVASEFQNVLSHKYQNGTNI
jgi:hypothetical protein